MSTERSITIREAIESVADFNEKFRVSSSESPADWLPDGDMICMGRVLVSIANSPSVMGRLGQRRWLRLHLMLEELGELLVAMGEADVVASLDGLSDLLYVTLGTAATFDLPLEDGFAEVHRSNMTKEKQPSDPHADRGTEKGPRYVSPDLESVYRNHLQRRSANGNQR